MQYNIGDTITLPSGSSAEILHFYSPTRVQVKVTRALAHHKLGDVLVARVPGTPDAFTAGGN